MHIFMQIRLFNITMLQQYTPVFYCSNDSILNLRSNEEKTVKVNYAGKKQRKYNTSSGPIFLRQAHAISSWLIQGIIWSVYSHTKQIQWTRSLNLVLTGGLNSCEYRFLKKLPGECVSLLLSFFIILAFSGDRRRKGINQRL